MKIPDYFRGNDKKIVNYQVHIDLGTAMNIKCPHENL